MNSKDIGALMLFSFAAVAQTVATSPLSMAASVPQLSVGSGRITSFQNGKFLSADYAHGIHAGFSVHDADGKPLFNDLVRVPGATQITIFSLTASPAGEIAVAGFAFDESNKKEPFIALYADTLTLARVIRLTDFLPRTLIYSATGQLYAFGPERGPNGAWLASGNCLRVFDSDGRELKRGLPRPGLCQQSTCFPFEDIPVVAAGPHEIAIYIPEVNRLYRFPNGSTEFTSREGLPVWERRSPKVMVASGPHSFLLQHTEASSPATGTQVFTAFDESLALRRLAAHPSLSPAYRLVGSDGSRFLFARSSPKDFLWLARLE